MLRRCGVCTWEGCMRWFRLASYCGNGGGDVAQVRPLQESCDSAWAAVLRQLPVQVLEYLMYVCTPVGV